jgi:hypothetical protein
MRAAALAVAILLCTSFAQAQTITGYFGPEKGTIADPQRNGIPTSVFESRQYCMGSTCYVATVCLLAIDTYGPSVGDPYVEVSTQRVNAALHLPGGVYVPPDSPINCRLLTSGKCVQIQGHTISPADAFGESWIVDSFSLPSSCP